MQIKLNNRIHELAPPYPQNIQQVLALLMPDLKTNGIAVALNDRVIPRAQWTSTPIISHAELLIITATQGG